MQDNILLYRMPGPSVVQDADVEKLNTDLTSLVQGHSPALVAIDCSATHYVSSRVLGLLVAFCNKIGESNGRVVLFGVTPATERVLSVTRLNSLLNVVENEEEARLRLARA